MGKNVFITGIAGFLGSHLAFRHLAQGDHVWGVDNFSSSRQDSKHLARLLGSSTNDGLIHGFWNRDVCDPLVRWYGHKQGFNAVINDARFDVVYNMACPASPPIYQRLPIETTMTCTLGTKNVLDLAADHGAIVVHASTSEVYGNPLTNPQVETDCGNVHSYGPRACYDEGKRCAEALCFDYLNKRGVDVRIARIFNTYGPHMDPNDGRVVSNFICQAVKGEPLTVYGDGSQTRSLCYVSDLVRGLQRLGELKENPKTPVNIGNPNEMCVFDIGMEVVKKIGGTVTKGPLPTHDPERRCPDITLAKNLLGWEPQVSLSDGLDSTIAYFRTLLQR